MLIFNFLAKGLGLVSPSHFVYDFSRKMFLIVTFYILTKFETDAIKFEINLIFLNKSFCYMTKNSRQKLKYHENKKSFWVEIKSIFHHFRLKPESPPSIYNIILKISLHILIICKFRLKLSLSSALLRVILNFKCFKLLACFWLY